MAVGHIPKKDLDGAPLSRIKTAKEGWHYEPQAIEIHTLKHGSGAFVNIDKDGNDLGHVTAKIYDSFDVEITDPLLEATAVKTVIDWEPKFDYEIIGGIALIPSLPVNPIRMFVEGLPNVQSTMFLNGGLNLKHVGAMNGLNTDGRTSKFLQYNNPVAGTNTLRIILKYSAAEVFEFTIVWEIYKA